jgi:hypothetical protein
MTRLRNLSFVLFLVAFAAAPPQRVEAGNWCYIFLGSCNEPDWETGRIRADGCTYECSIWLDGCCEMLCGQYPQYDSCEEDSGFCDPDTPNCLECLC